MRRKRAPRQEHHGRRRHVAIAVPLRAVDKNQRVAASVLAGGFAYRIFLWLLPFGLIVGGALGLVNANDTEEAVERGGLPGAITNTIGDAARYANSDTWWLLAVGLPLLVWAGFSGAKAVTLIHSLVWDEPPPRAQAAPGVTCLHRHGVCVHRRGRNHLVVPRRTGRASSPPCSRSRRSPPCGSGSRSTCRTGTLPGRRCCPGALLVAIGFQVLHEVTANFLVPKLEKSTSLYGDLGATTTFLFFMYIPSILVVSAPVINSSLYEELRASATGPSRGTPSRRVRGSAASARDYTRPMAMAYAVQRLRDGRCRPDRSRGRGRPGRGQGDAGDRSNRHHGARLATPRGRDDFVREWPLGEQVTVVCTVLETAA